MKPTLLQITTDSLAVKPVVMKQISVIDLLSDPGTLLIVVPLLIFSIIALYIFFERWMTLNKVLKIDGQFMPQIRAFIHDTKLDAAKALCQSNTSPFARMVEKGIMRIGKPLGDIKTEIENVAQMELNKLEKGTTLLATIAGVSPMLGFLGTVMGMVVTFHQLKAGGQAVKVDELSGGIMQALVTTIAGLIVGILAYLCYNILTAKTQQVAHKMDAVNLEFMDVLQEPVK
jgi:biopolymer transport protein ExbB